MEVLMHIIGFMFIWAAVDYKREEPISANLISKEFITIMILVLIGAFLLRM
jgi:hypothetical protein